VSGEEHRAGVVALLGQPNAGKSTLLNQILGEKLAIVTAKPQTTRSRILGITTRPDVQILWTDTPGFLGGSRPLAQLMQDALETVAQDCDVALLIVDLRSGWEPLHQQWWKMLADAGKPTLAVGTQLDRAEAAERPWPPPGIEASAAFRVSGTTGTGVEALVQAVAARLPPSPPLYPGDQLTDRPLRFLAAEYVREAAFQLLQQELPYSVAVQVSEFDESDPSLVRIRAELLVERDSQKRIVVGQAGRVIKEIGVRARRQIEQLLGVQVHLALWVKVDPQWLKRPKRLKRLGYF
jgi:GTP-binding protein Era